MEGKINVLILGYFVHLPVCLGAVDSTNLYDSTLTLFDGIFRTQQHERLDVRRIPLQPCSVFLLQLLPLKQAY